LFKGLNKQRIQTLTLFDIVWKTDEDDVRELQKTFSEIKEFSNLKSFTYCDLQRLFHSCIELPETIPLTNLKKLKIRFHYFSIQESSLVSLRNLLRYHSRIIDVQVRFGKSVIQSKRFALPIEGEKYNIRLGFHDLNDGVFTCLFVVEQ